MLLNKRSLTRVNVMLDDETLAILGRLEQAAPKRGTNLNRSALIRALVKGADVLNGELLRSLRDGENDLAFLSRTGLLQLVRSVERRQAQSDPVRNSLDESSV